MAMDRRRLRETFESAAALYQRARPDYPVELYDELVSLAALRPGDRLLEIGCATGKATRPLAERGLCITCVELGEQMAAAARRNLAALADVEVVHASFEEWRPPAGETFDLVFAATAWKWVDPELRCRKAWQLLRPGGHLAIWDAVHVVPDEGDPFFREIQPAYEEIGEGMPAGAGWPRPGELPGHRREIEASGLFDQVQVRHFDWEVVYDADGYIDLLDTFAGHIAMADWQRERLYGEMRRYLSRRSDGRLRRHWGAVLNVATKL
jgi:SAM-dependent methyltransferase